jgi:23S rRNA (guanine2445-N2)-methyltransferase / 23S rRNA (guanine2069-N7)-methyltransferase
MQEIDPAGRLCYVASMHAFFATAPKGLEEALAAELRGLSLQVLETARGGVRFQGELEAGYRACLHSRVANRILLPLATFAAPDPEALYQGTKAVPWADHLGPQQTLAVDFSTSRSAIHHTHFGALKVKDAIVDKIRERHGARPDVRPDRPDVQVNVHLASDVATVSLDLSGESLHLRGYRKESVRAPLKENLAAGILLLAGWPEHCRDGAALLDPMCGSGTLPIEAGLIAARIAPGLNRSFWGFLGWSGHDGALWERLLDEARGMLREEKLPAIVGTDHDFRAVRAALANVEAAGLRGIVHIEKRELAEAVPTRGRERTPRGLFVVNPPYGERLGEKQELETLYGQMGELLRRQFGGWDAYVFTGNVELARRIKLEPARKYPLFNGPIECRLLRYPIKTAEERPVPPPDLPRHHGPKGAGEPVRALAFANRLTKNLKHLRKWARREGVSCFRAYDKDLPEYAVAVDIYEQHVHVQEYAPPDSVDPRTSEGRLLDLLTTIPAVCEVPREHVFVKTRQRQKDNKQYEKLDTTGRFYPVHEGGHQFLVNFTDYLDTGLFLDHRPTRALLQRLASGKRFLNLFAYTATATVYAAAGGASGSTSVDMSNTYVDWAKNNFKLNGLAPRHELIRADVLEWLRLPGKPYDLIFLDPPTHSRSKKMDGDFDIQRDQVMLLRAVSQKLAPGGTLLFSNNFRRFKLEEEALPELAFEEISKLTLPPDFERNPRIHRCWQITRRA